jgi:hypothetical protein
MNAEQIFREAVGMPNLKERQAYLDRACKGDDAVRAAVEALLRADGDAGNFLKAPALDPNAALDSPYDLKRPGAVNGLPLVAGPESTAYRLYRFVRRHQAFVLGGVTGLAVGLVVTLVMYLRFQALLDVVFK